MERFWKAHGLGNDYLVLDHMPSFENTKMTASMVVKVCDRHRGLGADGILEPINSDCADVGVRIWNPDGSIAEKSGNGLRIFAWWWVVHRQQGSSSTPFTVDTGSEVVICEVNESEGWVDVQMGQARFNPDEIPTTELVWGTQIEMPNETIVTVYTVGIGNPHCVVFVDSIRDLDNIPWRRWGAFLENHSLFPNRINVQFAAIQSESEIEIRIWERGAGETQASGSSSCAVACVAHKLGFVGSVIKLSMPGGALHITIQEKYMVQLRGPVEAVAQMTCL